MLHTRRPSLHPDEEIADPLILVLLRKPDQLIQPFSARKFTVLREEGQIFHAVIFDEMPCHLDVVLLDEGKCVAGFCFTVHSEDDEILESDVKAVSQSITVQHKNGLTEITMAFQSQLYCMDFSLPVKFRKQSTF